MPSEAAQIDAGSGTDAAPKGGVRLAARIIDRRTSAWKRRCELVEAYVAAFGGPGAVDDVLASKIEMTAEMRVIAELSRAKFLADTGNVSLEDIVRLENQAARAERALGLPKHGSNGSAIDTGPVAGSQILEILRRRREEGQ